MNSAMQSTGGYMTYLGSSRVKMLLRLGLVLFGLLVLFSAQSAWAAPVIISGSVNTSTRIPDGQSLLADTIDMVLVVGTSTPSIHEVNTGSFSTTFSFSIDDGNGFGAGTPFIIFTKDDTNFKGTLVSKAAGTSDITSLNVYVDRVTVDHEGVSATSTSIADMSLYDSTDDANISYTASTSLDSLHVLKGHEFYVSPGATFVAAASTTFSGSFDNAGTFDSGSGKVLFDDIAFADTSMVSSDNTSVASQDTAPRDMAFNTDGTKMFVLGDTGNDINEYELFAAYTLSPAPSFTGSFSVATEGTNPTGFAFNASGNSVYVIDGTTATITKYVSDISNFTVSDYSVTGESFSVAAQETSPTGLAFSPDGLKMFVVGTDSDAVHEYSLPSGCCTLSSASFVASTSIAAQDTSPTGLTFNPSGSRMYVLGDSGNDVSEYILSTNFDISTASFYGSVSLGGTNSFPTGLAFNVAGNKLFVSDNSLADRVFEYGLKKPAEHALSGTMVGTSAFNDLSVSSETAVVFESAASTSDITITEGSTVVASAQLSISGDYTNNGTFDAATSEVFFSGSGIQTISGLLTGDSAFYDLTFLNTSAVGDSAQSVIVESAISTTNTLTMLASTSVEFLAGEAATFENIDLQGVSGSPVWLRSSVDGTQFTFDVAGTQTQASFINAQDANACSARIEATDFIDSGNNNCWGSVIISGVLYSDEGETVITTGKTIAVRVATSTPGMYTATSDGSGAYSIDTGTDYPGGDVPIFVWVDGDAVNANVIMKSPGTTNLSDIDLYQNYVIINTKTATSSVISDDLDLYEDDDDGDMLYSVLSLGSNFLTMSSVTTFLVDNESAFYTEGLDSLSFNDVMIRGSFTATGTQTIFVSGSWTRTNGSYFDPADSIVNMTAGAGNNVVDGNFNNLLLSGTDTRVAQGTLDIAGDLSADAGSLTSSDNMTVHGGTLDGNGVLTFEDGTHLADVKEVSVGSRHTCALTNKGSVYCWGLGNTGNLGNGAFSQQNTPVQVMDGEATGDDSDGGYLTNVKKVATGLQYTCATTYSGSVYCWGGANTVFILGNGLEDNNSNTPVQVIEGFATGDDTDGTYLTNVKDISAGETYACVTTYSGKAYCWGVDFGNSSLGNVGDANNNTPLQVQDGTATGSDTDGTYLINVDKIEAMINHVCAVTYSGNVYCWGGNENGQHGNNATSTVNSTAVQVQDGDATGADSDGTYLTNVAELAVGGDHTCATTHSGKFYCWGQNTNGELGDNTTTDRLTPIQVQDGAATGDDTDGTYLSNVATINLGGANTCVTTNSSKVYCWGGNTDGELGDNTVGTDRLTPVRVLDGVAAGNDTDGTYLSNITAIDLGADHACAVNYSGSVYCWGSNNFGELGDNTEDADRLTPVQVQAGEATGVNTDITRLSNVASVSAGDDHSCALTNTGSVYCWGDNSDGELGDSTTGTDRTTPVQVQDGTATGNDTDGTYLVNIKEIEVGDDHSCALANSGSVYCWGQNAFGQLGDSTSGTDRTTPVQVQDGVATGNDTNGTYLANVKEITSGNGHTCALTNTGSVYCWGDNSDGELGDNTSGTNRLTPVQVQDGVATGNDSDGTYLANVSSVSAAGDNTCALTHNSYVYCWGENAFAQLGDNTEDTDRLTPVQVQDGTATGDDTDGTYLTNVVSVSAGGNYTCATTHTGSVYCWGSNFIGQLGDNTSFTQRNTPIQVQDGTATGNDTDGTYLSNVASISAGGLHTCATTHSGSIYCWGDNGWGELGDSTFGDRLTPVQVQDGTAAGNDTDGTYLANAASVSVGGDHTCANTNDGSVYCWGRNTDSQVGDDAVTSRSTPVSTLRGASNESSQPVSRPVVNLLGDGDFGGSSDWEFADLVFGDGYTVATTSLVGTGLMSASSTLLVKAGGVASSSQDITLGGVYRNDGTFIHNENTVTFAGVDTQIATGTLTGTSQFNDLAITNTSGTGDLTQSVAFGAAVTATGTFSMIASTSVSFLAGATASFTNVDLLGGVDSSVWMRSSDSGTAWSLDIPGSQINVEYVDAQDSDASLSSGGEVVATNSTDSGNNTNWSFSAVAGVSTWNESDWTAYDTITIDSANIDDDLTNFPMYVDLADLSSTFWSTTPADASLVGTDIRITTNAESPVELARELVSASSTAQTGELHFKANIISSTTDTIFRVYYNGNADGDYDVDATYGSENVWTNGYVAVYHSANDGADSTANGYTLTANGGAGTVAGGQIGSAFDFDGTGDFYASNAIDTSYGGRNEYTISAWSYLNTIGTTDSVDDAAIFSYGDSSNNVDILWFNVNQNGTGDRAYSWNTYQTSNASNRVNGSESPTADTWHHVTATRNGTARGVYYNGTIDNTSSGNASNNASPDMQVRVGSWSNGPSFDFNGRMDEVRIATLERDAAWISAEYLNQSTTTDFYSVSEVVPAVTYWNPTDWTAYDTITIDNTNIDSTLTDFPVYVDLSDLSASFWSTTPADASLVGTDIRITTDSGSPVELAREIVSASSTTQTGELHFKANTISSSVDTVFRVYFNGTTTGDYATTSPFGAQNVWTNDYVAVYHMNEDPSGGAGAILDSTEFTNNGTSFGSMTSDDLVSTTMGQGINLDGTNDYMAFGPDLPTTDYNYSFWYDPDTSSDAILLMVAGSASAGNDNEILVQSSASRMRTGALNATTILSGALPISASGGSYYFSTQRNGSAMQQYVNGTLDGTGTNGTVFDYDTCELLIGTDSDDGCDGSLGNWTDGVIDSVRVASSSRTAAWISAEHLNQSSDASFYTTSIPAREWNATDWTQYDTITIDSTNIDSTLTNFPVYVDLADLSANFWSTTPAGAELVGTDIRITTNAESPVELARELVSASSTAQTGELHFKADTISSSVDTVFRVYYNGTTGGDYATTSTYGAQNVWSDYDAVWHFDQDPSSDALEDSTLNNNDGASEGSMTSSDLVDGQVGRALSFDEVNDRIAVSDDASLSLPDGDWNYSTWINLDDNTGSFFQYFTSWGTVSATPSVNFFIHEASGSAPLNALGQIVNNGTAVRTTDSFGLSQNWQHVQIQRESGTVTFYIDGVADPTTGALAAGVNVNDSFYIGGRNDANADRYFGGLLDNMRLQDRSVSQAWISAEYLNQSTTTDFYSVAINEAEVWNATDWTTYDTITIDNTNIDSTLTDFPVYVDLADLSANFWSTTPGGASVVGTDIRITTNTGSPVELPRELVSADLSTQTGELHFRADTISSSVDTVFRVYYNGSTEGDYLNTATFGAQNVWTNDYVAVYHMNEDPSGGAGALLDSTEFTNNGTSFGSMTSDDLVSTTMGQGIDFDGTNDYIIAGPDLPTTDFSYSVWADLDTVDDEVLLMSAKTNGTNEFILTSSSFIKTFVNNSELLTGTTPVSSAGGPYYYSTQRSGSAAEHYLNASVEDTATNATVLDFQSCDLLIGTDSDSGCAGSLGNWLNGQIDSIRIASSSRTTGWISAEYLNQSTTTDFYAVGAAAAVTAGSSTIANHDDSQVNNNFNFQNKTNEALFAFKLIPESGNATVTDLVITLSGAKSIDTADFSNIRLYRDHDADADYDATDTQVGGAGVMSLSNRDGDITFTADFLATTTENFVLIADWDAPINGSFLNFNLYPGDMSVIDDDGTQEVFGVVDSVQHNRNNKGGGGGSSAAIGGDAPPGRATTTGGTNDGGEQIGDNPDYKWPTTHSGAWTGGASAYDKVDGTYAASDAFSDNETLSFNDHGFVVPGANTISGIEVKLEAAGTPGVLDIEVELSHDGGTSWTAIKSATVTIVDTVYVFGGASDLWGRVWTQSEFNNANFVVRLTSDNASADALQVDAIQVRVYHQTGGGSSGGGGAI